MQEPGTGKPDGARVIDLVQARSDRRWRTVVEERVSRCTKCTSTFVQHEPAFVHCRFCGNMMRVAGAAVMDQDTYELRSGLRSVDAVAAGLYG
jgi:heterodisulfide reductase subunit A-like polyferredoxin